MGVDDEESVEQVDTLFASRQTSSIQIGSNPL